jgi:hypothetical protein
MLQFPELIPFLQELVKTQKKKKQKNKKQKESKIAQNNKTKKFTNVN